MENSCYICYREFFKNKQEAFTELDKIELIDDEDERSEKLADFFSFVKGPEYKCPTQSCLVEICSTCFCELTENFEKTLGKDKPYKCPYCRNVDWKLEMDMVLFYVMKKSHEKQGSDYTKIYVEKLLKDLKY